MNVQTCDRCGASYLASGTGPAAKLCPKCRTVAPAQSKAAAPQPEPAQQPSPPSPPIRNTTTPAHVALPDENALKSAEKKSARKMSSIRLLVGGGIGLLVLIAKSARKKPSIGLLAGGGIGLLVLIACIAIAVVRPNPERERTQLVTEPNRPTPEPPTKKTKDPEEIHAQYAGSVAFIKGKWGSGSGFVVSPNVIATNSHVIGLEFDRDLEIHFPSASGNDDKGPFHAELVFEDAKRDLAFLSVRTKLRRLEVAEAFEFHPGMSITIIGSPSVGDGVVKNAVSNGLLSTKDRQMDQDFYQLGASVNPGNSGGPVFDKYGEVIGVVALKASMQEAIAWCIPVDDLRLGISRVSSQSQETASESGSRHHLRVVCRLLTLLGSVMDQGLDGYIQAMLDSINNKEDPKEGLKAAASKFLPVLKRVEDKLAETGLKDEIGELSRNRATDPQSRQQLFAIWGTIQHMKTLLDRPTWPPLAFANDASKLKTTLLRQIHFAQSRLGIPADEG